MCVTIVKLNASSSSSSSLPHLKSRPTVRDRNRHGVIVLEGSVRAKLKRSEQLQRLLRDW